MKAGYMHHVSPAESEAIRDSNFNKLEPGHLFGTSEQGKVFLVMSKDDEKVFAIELSQESSLRIMLGDYTGVILKGFVREKMSTINILNRE